MRDHENNHDPNCNVCMVDRWARADGRRIELGAARDVANERVQRAIAAKNDQLAFRLLFDLMHVEQQHAIAIDEFLKTSLAMGVFIPVLADKAYQESLQ